MRRAGLFLAVLVAWVVGRRVYPNVATRSSLTMMSPNVKTWLDGVVGSLKRVSLFSGKGSRRRYRLLVLFSDTGGGHRASAVAIGEALEKQFPGTFEFELMDIWTSAGVWPLNQMVSSYRYLGRRPWLWRVLWYTTANYWTRGTIRTAHDAQHRRRFGEAMRSGGDWDAVLSVHPLCQHVPISAVRQMGWKIPFVTVVTDLGSAHPMWFDSRADRVFVPNDKVARLAHFHGFPQNKVTAHGLPLRAQFYSGRWVRKRNARLQNLKLGSGSPNILIVGGGDGVGKLDKLVQAVYEKVRDKLNVRLTVVCGRNVDLQTTLKSLYPAARVKVLGFVSNMHELMSDADILLSKAGPGTIAEAATLGLPVILTSFLPGQERGNARLVKEQGFGILERRPHKAARLLTEWLDDPNKLASMSRNAFESSTPDSTSKIAYDIAHMIFKSSRREQKPPQLLLEYR